MQLPFLLFGLFLFVFRISVFDKGETSKTCGKDGTQPVRASNKATESENVANVGVVKRTDCDDHLFSCDVCLKSFKTRALLITHTRIHAGERRKCKICRKAFRQLGHFKTYYSWSWTALPFICTACHDIYYKDINWRVQFRRNMQGDVLHFGNEAYF